MLMEMNLLGVTLFMLLIDRNNRWLVLLDWKISILKAEEHLDNNMLVLQTKRVSHHLGLTQQLANLKPNKT